MNSKVNDIKALFDEKLGLVATSEQVEELRVEFMGKKGLVADLMSELKNVPNEEKKAFGQEVNVLKQEIEKKIAEKRAAILEAEQQKLIDMLKLEANDFRSALLMSYAEHIELIKKLPELAAEEVAAMTAAAVVAAPVEE